MVESLALQQHFMTLKIDNKLYDYEIKAEENGDAFVVAYRYFLDGAWTTDSDRFQLLTDGFIEMQDRAEKSLIASVKQLGKEA